MDLVQKIKTGLDIHNEIIWHFILKYIYCCLFCNTNIDKLSTLNVSANNLATSEKLLQQSKFKDEFFLSSRLIYYSKVTLSNSLKYWLIINFNGLSFFQKNQYFKIFQCKVCTDICWTSMNEWITLNFLVNQFFSTSQNLLNRFFSTYVKIKRILWL